MGEIWDRYERAKKEGKEQLRRFNQRVASHPVVEAGRDVGRVAVDVAKHIPVKPIDPVAFVSVPKKKKR